MIKEIKFERPYFSDSFNHYLLKQQIDTIVDKTNEIIKEINLINEKLNRRNINKSNKKIQVIVQGGVAYCDDPRVEIIDNDNKE